MSRRVSSRDDLFLSGVDLFLMLSFVFIGVSFMSGLQDDDRSLLDLPVKANDERPGTDSDGRTLELRWRHGGDGKPGDLDKVCEVEEVRRGAPFFPDRPGPFKVPCHPVAFGGKQLPGEFAELVEDWKKDHGNQPLVAVIDCERDDITACAQLQWVIAESRATAKARLAVR